MSNLTFVLLRPLSRLIYPVFFSLSPKDWTRDLGLGQSNRPPKKKKKSRSADVDRVPRLGLDRAWENERVKGMELLHQSVERQRERQRHRDGAVGAEATSREAVHHGKSHGKKKKKDKERHRSRSHSRDRLEHYLVDPPFRGPAALIDPNFRVSARTVCNCMPFLTLCEHTHTHTHIWYQVQRYV